MPLLFIPVVQFFITDSAAADMVAPSASVADAGVQTDSEQLARVQEHAECRQLFSAEKSCDRDIHFYTGLETYAKFKMVLSTLGPAIDHCAIAMGLSLSCVSIEDQ